MLRIYKPPYSQSSAHDILGNATVEFLCRNGFETCSFDLWPDRWAAALNCGNIPIGRKLFRSFLAPRCASQHVSYTNKGDTAWILGSMVPLATAPRQEIELKKKGVRYIYHVIDNWFDVPFLREATLERCKIADCLVVPTPQLVERIRSEKIKTPVLRLEEPIDVDRLAPPASEAQDPSPFLVWCGNPNNVRNFERILSLLNRLWTELPFRLRVVSNGRPSRNFDFKGKLEWLPYDYIQEGALLAGARAGLAPLEDTPYNRCKGAYKIKTYMAAGVPVIASRVGYQVDLLHSGKSGFLVDSDEEWLDTLSFLLKNENVFLQMATYAREEAVSMYSHKVVIPGWVNQLKSML